ncbi:Uncharacterised protein [Bordetella pertussis]|nr:Uncharacterised protein [Bordetella pertussis]
MKAGASASPGVAGASGVAWAWRSNTCSMRGWSQARNWRRSMATRSARFDSSRTLPG